MAAVVDVMVSLFIQPRLVRDGWPSATAASGICVLVALPRIIVLLMREPKRAATPASSPKADLGSNAAINPAAEAIVGSHLQLVLAGTFVYGTAHMSIAM